MACNHKEPTPGFGGGHGMEVVYHSKSILPIDLFPGDLLVIIPDSDLEHFHSIPVSQSDHERLSCSSLGQLNIGVEQNPSVQHYDGPS